MGGHQLDQEKQELENPTAPQPKLRPNPQTNETPAAVRSQILPSNTRGVPHRPSAHG